MNPWITPELNTLINQKSVYFELFRLGIVTKRENNNFKNKVRTAINKAKFMYYKKVFDDSFGNMKLTWKTLNNLMGRDTKKSIKSIIFESEEIFDDKNIADIFNKYFANVPLILDSKVTHSDIDPVSYIQNDINSYLTEFYPCDPNEVSDIIHNLKPSKVSLNSIPTKLIQGNRDMLSVVICDIINRSFACGVFPDVLKIGTIIPVHKRGCDRIPANYRPITISPFLSKVFEKVIYSRLIDHFDCNNIISAQQFGFRKNMSTFDALIQVTEFIYKALNDRKSCLNILIDYSRAFDTVNHEILLKKLKRYGIQGLAHQLISSFLLNRKQCVRINNIHSDYITTNISIPQGSVVGPLLFITFINCLPNISQNFLATMFADDCTLSFSSDNRSDLIRDSNNDLVLFKQWSDANRLTINIDKTNCLFISNISIPPAGNIQLDNHELDFVEETKFLGIYLDSEVKYSKHIEHVCNKISVANGIMYRIRSYVPKSCLKNIYYSIVHQYILYCLPIYGATYNCYLEKLFLAQKRSIRIISQADYYAHTEPLFFSNKILKVKDLYKHFIACYIFSRQHLLEIYRTTHNYPTRSSDLMEPQHRLRSTEQSFMLNAVRIWNSVPDYIKTCRTESSFKYKYKLFLLSHYNS